MLEMERVSIKYIGYKKNFLFVFRRKIIHTPFYYMDANNVSSTVWVNTTMEISTLVYVLAVDNGNPRRGDYVTLNITYSITCQEFGKVIADETSGDVYFRAPKMRLSVYGMIFLCR